MPTETTKKFVLEGEFGDLVRGVQEVNLAMDRMDKKFSLAVKSLNKVDNAASMLTKGMRGILGGLGIGTAIATASKGWTLYNEAIERANARTLQFSDEMAGLLSLGDFSTRIQETSKHVVDLSMAFNSTTRDVAGAWFNIESQSGHLDKTIKEGILRSSLELARVTGTDLQLAVTGISKAMGVYGREVAGVSDMTNRLKIAADRGGMEFNDMAEVLPNISAAASNAGIGLNEFLASMTVLTRLGGQPSVMGRGFRGVINNLTNSMEFGIPVADSYFTKLEKLAKMNPGQLVKIFGDEGSLSISILTRELQKVKEEFVEMEKVALSAGNAINTVFQNRLTDPGFINAQTQKASAAYRAEQDREGANTRDILEKESIRGNLPPFFRNDFFVWMSQGISKVVHAGHIFGNVNEDVLSAELRRTATERTVGDFSATLPRRRAILTPAERQRALGDDEVHAQRQLNRAAEAIAPAVSAAAGAWNRIVEKMNRLERRVGLE